MTLLLELFWSVSVKYGACSGISRSGAIELALDDGDFEVAAPLEGRLRASNAEAKW